MLALIKFVDLFIFPKEILTNKPHLFLQLP